MPNPDQKVSSSRRLGNFLRFRVSPTSQHPWAVGVDLTPWVIRLVLVERRRDDTFRIAGCQSVPVDPLWDLDSPALVRALHDGLRALTDDVGPLEIWVGLSVDRVRMHHLELPRMKGAQLSQAIYWGLQREEAFSPSDTVLDYEVEGEVGTGKKPALAISGYLVPKTDRDTLGRLFRQAGYPLHGIALPLHAARNHFSSGWLPTPEQAVALCHIGSQSTRIAILAGQRLVLTRVLPIGLEQLADALLESLAPVPQRTLALRMILELGRASWSHPPYGEEEVFGVLRPALERLARQIDRTLEYYRIQFTAGQSIERVYLAGALNESPQCREHLARLLPAPLEFADPLAELGENGVDAAQIPADPIDRQSYATALGYALAGEEQAPNFLQTFRERQRQILFHRLNTGIFFAFAVLALVLGGIYASQLRSVERLEREHASMQARVRAAAPLLDAEGVLSRAGQLHQDHRALLQSLERRRPEAMIAELGLLTPPTIRLDTISSQLGQPRPSDTVPAGRWLRLSGVVSGDPEMLETELSLFVRSLETSPLFASVEVRDRSQNRRAGALELDFALEMQLPPSTLPTP